jgi:NAD(P)-dependent dehydrogenase (short-subunit alcohol dehydrogenase family)
MPDFTRRTLLAGVAATGALAAAATRAQPNTVEPPTSLKGKSILITGCSSGFGRLGAEHFARLGAKVFATMRNLPRPEAQELQALAARDNLDITVLELDVTSDEQVVNAVGEAERLAGGALDVLVNNAGIGISGPVEVQDMEATKLIFDTNVYGCHRMARAVLPAMRAKKSGLIIPVSSQLGRVIAPFSGHYSPTKFALEAMSEAMAYELVPHGIEVSIVQPGGYPTDVWVNRKHLYRRAERPGRGTPRGRVPSGRRAHGHGRRLSGQERPDGRAPHDGPHYRHARRHATLADAGASGQQTADPGQRSLGAGAAGLARPIARLGTDYPGGS